MTKNIFISYSRRELGFVDDLVGRLEGEQYQVWLDYRALIPGSPWKEQIDQGLSEADTVLLVVSKAALASEYVALEWRHFLETKQRFILLIFEAVDLPKELEGFEWVDFRGSYEAGLNELLSQLKKPVQETQRVPETGFKAPAIVWLAIAVSVVVALLSFSEIWTLFIPWFLIPLPYRIFKRDFNFTQVQTALWALPIASVLSVIVYDDASLDIIAWLGLIFGTILLFILRSAGMQRWGKPEAIIPKYINPHDPKIPNPSPVPFYVDYAVEDRIVAGDLIETLKKYGHPQVENIQEAKAVFALISQFKSDTEAIPEKQMLFPVLIQTNENVSKKLSRIQWIDFRPGVRGLDTIAQLLPHPKELLKALGMRPVSSQTVYSPAITAIYYFISLVTIVSVGASLHYMFKPAVELLPYEYVELIAILLSFCGLAYFMVKGVTSRKGFFAGVTAIVLGIVVLGGLMFWQKGVNARILNEIALGEAPVTEEVITEEVVTEEVEIVEEEEFVDDEAAFSEDEENIYASDDEITMSDFVVTTDEEFSLAFAPEFKLEFVDVVEYVYYLGIVLMGFVFFRNRRDVKRWLPPRNG